MNADVTPAIIMRVKDLGESDLLVTFFALQKGRLKGIAKGARKSRKRFVNALDLFSLVSLEYAPRRQGDLLLLHSAKLIDAYPGLRSAYSLLSKASYMVELTEILFPPGVPDQGMFELLTLSLDALSRGEQTGQVPLVFEFKAMSLGGYRIDTSRCAQCGRPYQGEGAAVFKQERGGISCLKCAQPSALSPPLEPGSVKALQTFLDKAFAEAMGLQLEEETMRELKAVLKLHREYRLERKLRTSKYVE